MKQHTSCRICGSENLTKYLDLGNLPLANNLGATAEESKSQEKYPLQLLFCNSCGLSQLSVVIDPRVMFSYYPYRSSVNLGYIEHCKKMAHTLLDKYELNKDSFHIDIAGNDGTLLKEFKKATGSRVLNIDPAKNLIEISERERIPGYQLFWGSDAAKYVRKTIGEADLITATNVVAHVDNLQDFFLGVKLMLKPAGVFVMECPYIVDFIEGLEFSTIYHEHLSYISVRPIAKLCSLYGLKIIACSKQDIHCGSIRIEIAHQTSEHEPDESVMGFIENEIYLGYDEIGRYSEWAHLVSENIKSFANQIRHLKLEGSKIIGMCASAKGNTLLNCSGINENEISIIIDETPEKQGKFFSGTGIPIMDTVYLDYNRPDYILILSWNFKESIIKKLSAIGDYQYLIPIPELKIC